MIILVGPSIVWNYNDNIWQSNVGMPTFKSAMKSLCFIPQYDTQMVGYYKLCHTMMGLSTTVSGCVTLIKFH